MQVCIWCKVKKSAFYSCVLFPLALFSLLSICFHVQAPSGFAFKKVVSHHTYQSKWDTGPLTEGQKLLLAKVASQPFDYLRSEETCYVFVSRDKSLLFKLFNQTYMQTRSLFNITPFKYIPYFGRQQAIKRMKNTNWRNRAFTSCLAAYQRFAKQTGLLYLHLNKTNEIKKKVTLFPKKGAKVCIDLDSMEFLIQKNGVPVCTYLEEIMAKNNIEKARQAISSIFDLIIARGRAGIAEFDGDHDYQIGFIDGRACFSCVDFFRLVPPTHPNLADFYKITKHINEYLLDKYPELASFLDAQISEKSPFLTELL